MAEYIKREDALKEVDRSLSLNEAYSRIASRIIAADVTPVVHGHWIMRGGKRYCSACQKRACVTRDSDDFWYTVGTDYCPNCGARMDGAE